MKIEGPKNAQGAAKSKKSGAADNGDVDFSSYVSSGPQETAGTVSSQSIAQLDVLLAAQGVGDPTEKAARKRSRERADNVLKELEKVRISMLSGNLTVGHMIDVADVVASHRDKIHDPLLTAIMDEIDLRAQVELAKMRFAIDSRA